MRESLLPCSLGPAHAEAGLRLSRLANWNQTLLDWQCLLTEGEGCGMQTESGLLVASLVALPLGPHHGWISMVLTDPDFRRRGLAKALMASGLDFLEDRGLIPTLDATPAGETVYRGLGFAGDTGLARWKVIPEALSPAGIDPINGNIRQISDDDLHRLAAWDRIQSGCDRAALLNFLLKSRPQLAFLAENGDGHLLGYIMGRPGDRLAQLGPLVASSGQVAALLLETAAARLNEPFYVDAFDRTQPLLAEGLRGTWDRERGFTRLLLKASKSPENPETVFLAAGPELS